RTESVAFAAVERGRVFGCSELAGTKTGQRITLLSRQFRKTEHPTPGLRASDTHSGRYHAHPVFGRSISSAKRSMTRSFSGKYSGESIALVSIVSHAALRASSNSV